MKRWLSSAWARLLPSSGDALHRRQAGLVIATCLGLAAAILLLILVWLSSGDLQWETTVAGGIFCLILASIAALARKGRGITSVWLLAGLLAVLITLDAGSYGLGSPAAAGFVIPIVLTACGVGLWAGIGVACYAAAAVWIIAVAGQAGWYIPYGPFDISHLTFNAPAYTVIFLLVALIVGLWECNRTPDQC
ncbi:MAG TPA: hypothetical protein PKZ84_04265 [Anaerolineae bacterium]|nr:hypothetical protein [Anaerolineae bacterium]HQI83556.1 hypothetical protein [Anaerolineae bacterium]